MTTEQMAVPAVEQIGNVAEQVNPVAGATDAPVAAGAERAVADWDFSTPESVRAAADKFPAMRAVFADFENTGKQRALAEMRRERGTDESVREYHQHLVERLNAGEDPDVIARDTPLYVQANREAIEIALYQRLYEQAKAADPDAVGALDGFASQDGLTAEQWQGLSQAALNAVANTSKTTGKTEAYAVESLDDIPKDSPLWRLIDTKLTQEREAEVTAQQIEAKQLPAPPVTPTGAAVVGGRTPQDWAAMTDAQMDAATKNLSPEEFNEVMSMMLTAAKSGQ